MDIIAAISTAPAVAAIGVLRLSGAGAFAVADTVFRPLDGRALSAHPRRTMVLGALLDQEGRVMDQALAVTFAAGHSYTGEDSAEFHCHGSPVVLQEGLLSLFAAGARQAKGGEFTKRAFLSGNLDLTQAEAVIDLIEAETPQAARNAAGQVEGALLRRIAPIYDSLMDVASRFYAVVDYPDEDIEELTQEALGRALREAAAELRGLLGTFRQGQVLKNGLPTAILGRPNVGKSSLLNALTGYERAIVTDIPGTTRDTVEERVRCGGLLLRLIDTAGLRETEDPVEQLGVARSRAAAESAALCLVVIDASTALTEEDQEALRLAESAERAIAVVNKCDLPRRLTLPPLPFPAVEVSVKTGAGLEALTAAITDAVPAGTAPAGQILTNTRQAEAVARALQAIEGAAAALEGGLTPDAVLTDAEAGIAALGELTGRTLREDLVERIFSRFCVGK